MQNDSVLSKPKLTMDSGRLGCRSAGEQKAEYSRTAHGKGFQLHPQASATRFLVCPSWQAWGGKLGRRWAWPCGPWSQKGEWPIFHLQSSFKGQKAKQILNVCCLKIRELHPDRQVYTWLAARGWDSMTVVALGSHRKPSRVGESKAITPPLPEVPRAWLICDHLGITWVCKR